MDPKNLPLKSLNRFYPTSNHPPCPPTPMSAVPHTRMTYLNQAQSKNRRHQPIKYGRGVPPSSYIDDTCNATSSGSTYTQAVQFSPYALDYNPYIPLEITEQYTPWQTAASAPILTPLQPISVRDSTVNIPPAYPVQSPQELLVAQPPMCPHLLTRICRSTRLYKRPCLYQHVNHNNNLVESDLKKSCTETSHTKECLNEPETKENLKSAQDPKENDPDLLDAYFKLPAELFQAPRKLDIIDPNEIIDHMCSSKVSSQDMMWLLDLELGHPKKATNKPLASYDAQANMIISKDSTDCAMHPGFAQLDEEFKKTLLFYYDAIISSWYLGFVTFYGDFSVPRFQEWLSKVMDAYGMSWR